MSPHGRPAPPRQWLDWSAWALWALAVLGLATVPWFDHLLHQAHRPELTQLGPSTIPYLLAVVVAATVGAVLASRRPAHPVGWLLLALALSVTASGVADGYARYGLVAQPGALPAARWVAVYSPATLFIGLACVGFVLLLTPSGSLPSPRWRWWARATAAAPAGFLAALTLGPGLVIPPYQSAVNPVAVPALAGAVRITIATAFVLTAGGLAVGAWSLVVRFRHARGIERQQLRWIAFAAALTGVAAAVVLVGMALGATVVLLLAVGVCLAILPLATGAAILRYRLYDLDRIISRTLAYGLLTALATTVYLAIVVGIGTLVGSRGKPNLLLTVVATAVIAVAFQPARDRSRRLANRLVYGKRASPYEVLSGFSRGIARASTDDSLPRMARLVVEATGARQATVWLRFGDGLQPQASWPQTELPPKPIALEGRGVQEVLAETQPRSRSFPVGTEEEVLGALTVTISPAEPLTLASEKLIADLAAQTGLGLRFQRMKEQALFARALASFLPPEVAELVEASPSALSLREELEATILFSDIRGFSSLAERLPPRQVADVVGRHLQAMVEVVTAHGGVLDKFAGDAVMAVFGAPRPAADHARRALQCAAAMQRRQLALNRAAEHADLPTFQIGIGVNTGTVVAGTVGGAGRLDYTVLGDAVNIAQRLQSEAAGGEVLAAAVTVQQSGTDRAEPAGLKQLKGREHLVEVYRIRWVDTSTAQRSGETAHAARRMIQR
jgi:class 3 adenylate cyclase